MAPQYEDAEPTNSVLVVVPQYEDAEPTNSVLVVAPQYEDAAKDYFKDLGITVSVAIASLEV